MEWGMLRITVPTASHPGLFILEGRLSGLWVKEFLRVTRGTNQGEGNIFDLQEVLYVDSQGERALQVLARKGAKFITESAYGRDLCGRLKLKRLGPAGPFSNDGKGPGRSRRLREVQPAPAARLVLTPANSTWHPPQHAG